MITYREYWTEVDELADAVRALDESEDAFDALIELLDGHEFVIYYAKAQGVLVHSENQDAYWEMDGSLSGFDSYWDMIGPLALYAMQADVMDRASRPAVSENPTRARSNGYGRKSRRNYPKHQHEDLNHAWSKATDAWRDAQIAGNKADARNSDKRHLMRMASHSSGMRNAHYESAHEPWATRMKDVESFTKDGEKARDYWESQAKGNPPGSPYDGKWHRTGRAPYVIHQMGNVAGAAQAIPYKPRKFGKTVTDIAGAYEAQRGAKVPKGTKWLLRAGWFAETPSITAHKTLKSAKAAGNKALGVKKRKAKKTTRKNPPIANFKAKLKTSSRAKPQLVKLPASAKPGRYNGKIIHRSVSYANGKLKLLKGWTVSTPQGVGLARYKTRQAAVRGTQG